MVDRKKDAFSCLLKAASFCALHSPICNVHTVDFITGQKWELLQSNLRQELDQLSWDHLQALTNRDVQCVVNERDTPRLFQFISSAKAHTLEALNICTSLPTLSPLLPEWHLERKSPYWCMSPKKDHEVEIMASLVSSLAAKEGLEMVVDVGSGKGYLSSYLALEHRLNVLAIDSSSSNTSGADERNKKVLYFWDRSNKKKICNKVKSKSSFTSDPNENHGTYSPTAHYKASCSNFEEMNSSAHVIESEGTFLSRTHYISSSSDLGYIIDDFMLLQNEKNFNLSRSVACSLCPDNVRQKNNALLCSLHGCGSLSSSLLKLFVTTLQVKVLCSVGCCYHLIEESFFKSPFSSNGADETQEFGFPVSSVLISEKYQLGRNARMLASQSIDRISENKSQPKRALYYRALLEVILSEKFQGSSGPHTVGHVTKYSGFSAYVKKALQKLKLDSQLCRSP